MNICAAFKKREISIIAFFIILSDYKVSCLFFLSAVPQWNLDSKEKMSKNRSFGCAALLIGG